MRVMNSSLTFVFVLYLTEIVVVCTVLFLIVWWLRHRTGDSVVASSSPPRCRLTTLGKLFTPV